jgi:hypothetical protein
MAEVISALLAKRAEIAGHVEHLEKKASRWRARLASIDDAIKIFSPETDPEAIQPKRQYRSSRYFGRGEFARLCLDALRVATEPQTTAQILASVLRAKRIPDGSPSLTEKTLAYLRSKQAAALVVKTGTTFGAKWQLTSKDDAANSR